MAGEYRGDVQLEALPVGNWLRDLHMECYRRNLDDYPTVHVSRHCSCHCCCHYVCFMVDMPRKIVAVVVDVERSRCALPRLLSAKARIRMRAH